MRKQPSSFDAHDEEDDDDSYSDSELIPSPSKKQKVAAKADVGGSLNLTGSERLETSIANCAVWLQKGEVASGGRRAAAVKLPDLSQPPPPVLVKAAAELKQSPLDRQRRGLPNIRASHICSECSLLRVRVARN